MASKNEPRHAPAVHHQPRLAFAILATATSASITDIELVLPAVSFLPRAFGEAPSSAHFVIATYVGGSALGMGLFGELAARFDSRRLLGWALLVYGSLALLSAAMTSIGTLAALRLVQGSCGAAAIVFAPATIRAVFPGVAAVRALGRLGGIGAVLVALSPFVGSLIASRYGWRPAFAIPALPALTAGLTVLTYGRHLPRVAPTSLGGYGRLLRDASFLRYSLNQALSVAAILTFAFGTPQILLARVAGDIPEFVVLRAVGVLAFVSSAATG